MSDSEINYNSPFKLEGLAKLRLFMLCHEIALDRLNFINNSEDYLKSMNPERVAIIEKYINDFNNRNNE
jgi:hypothetical protein